jgi:adenylate kinase family enzyme
VQYVIAISGPVASGKSILRDQFVARFNTCSLSTRQLLIDRGVKNERAALIEAGAALDQDSDGSWVRDGVLQYVERYKDAQVVLIDCVRTERQTFHLRRTFRDRLFTSPRRYRFSRTAMRAATRLPIGRRATMRCAQIPPSAVFGCSTASRIA